MFSSKSGNWKKGELASSISSYSHSIGRRVVGCSLRSCRITYFRTDGSLSAIFSMSGRKSALTSTVEGAASFIAYSNDSGGSED